MYSGGVPPVGEGRGVLVEPVPPGLLRPFCSSRPLAVTEVLSSRHLPLAVRPPRRTGLPPGSPPPQGASLGHFWTPPQEICLSLTPSSFFQLCWGSCSPQAALPSPWPPPTSPGPQLPSAPPPSPGLTFLCFSWEGFT